MREIKEFLRFIENYKHSKIFMVTVVATEGSTYRKAGARKLISVAGDAVGLISGGCLESEIVDRCRNGTSFPFQFELSTDFDQDRFFGSNLGCLGKLSLECQVYDPSVLAHILKQELVSEEALKVHIVGAGPDTYPLKDLLDWTGWDYQFYSNLRDQVEELNDRGWKIQRFDSSSISLDIDTKTRSAVILMSHNYPIDLEVLRSMTSSSPNFIGILGPKSRRESLINDLQSVYNWVPNSEFLNKLHGPVGLDQMGRGEYAIALSIVAELQSFFYGK